MIYTDTMIWYKLSKEYNIQKIKVPLASTYINIIELVSSPNLKKDPILVQKTIKTLLNKSFFVEFLGPFDYLIFLDSGIIPDLSLQQNLLSDFFLFIQKDQDEILKISRTLHYTDFYLARQHQKEFSSIINNALEKNIRPRIKEYGKKHHELKRKENAILIREFIQFLVKAYSKQTYELSSNFNWEKVDLFAAVLDEYFLTLEKSSNMKFQTNDFHDIFNMVYVGSNDYYWTMEKKWSTLIKKVGRGSKLFDSYRYNFV